MSTNHPDWITPGAKVVCYNIGRSGRSENTTVTTILRVNKASFTVDDQHKTRFSLDAQKVDQGGTWGWTRKCVPYDSPEGEAARERARWRNAAHQPDAAADTWRQDRSDANRDALIAALQAVPNKPEGVR